MRCPNGGKKAYRTEDKAKEARKSLKYSGRITGLQRVYRCPACWKWHLTKSTY